MIKKTITYTDWNGDSRTEDFYFNLSKVEIAELEYGLVPGRSLSESIKTLINANDMATVIDVIKQILLKSYGEKSPDGKRFMKSPEISRSFEENPAFEIVYMELATNADYAADFISNLVPGVAESLGPNPKQAVLDKMKDFEMNNHLRTV